MPLRQVLIENLRCLERVEVELDPRLNLVFGPNGSGKTSFLEGLFLLGRGRSFRTRNSEKLITKGAGLLRVVGWLGNGVNQTLGIETSRNAGTVAKASGNFLGSLTDLTRLFPVQILDPGLHRLVEDGAHRRRRWLDWGVFHVEPAFAEHWARYGRALKQRNAVLKGRDRNLLAAFDRELLQHGQELAEARRRSMDAMRSYWSLASKALLDCDVQLSYFRGWAADMPFDAALLKALDRDIERATTSVGPHRADISLRVDGRPARDVLSRGQQKLVGAALTIAQLSYLKHEVGLSPTLLLDDPAAELDEGHLLEMVRLIQTLECPMIVTSLTPSAGALGDAQRVFHVEHGAVTRV